MKKAILNQMQPLDYTCEEALNSICTALTFAGRELKKIVFTSQDPSDGKSWMTMHIAVMLAQRGRRILLIDADLRRSALVNRHRIHFEGEQTGLAHYLTGQCQLADCIYETNYSGMCFLPVGRDVANPVTLLDSAYFTDTLNALTQEFDLIIIDAPPVGVVVDAAEIAGSCDGSVLVVQYNKTHLKDIAECKRQMEQSGTPVLGCIINKVDTESLSAKKYYNRGYYRYYKKEYARDNGDSKQSGAEAKQK